MLDLNFPRCHDSLSHRYVRIGLSFKLYLFKHMYVLRLLAWSRRHFAYPAAKYSGEAVRMAMLGAAAWFAEIWVA
jgi:hypothetical protein